MALVGVGWRHIGVGWRQTAGRHLPVLRWPSLKPRIDTRHLPAVMKYMQLARSPSFMIRSFASASIGRRMQHSSLAVSVSKCLLHQPEVIRAVQ